MTEPVVDHPEHVDPDLIERCLRILHGETGWRIIKHQWPDTALEERRRRMAEVILTLKEIGK